MAKAKTGSHLERHGERWCVVVKVPPSLRARIGRAWLKESLPAGVTPRQAETLKWTIIARFKEQLTGAAKAGPSNPGMVTEALAWRERLKEEEPPEDEHADGVADFIVEKAKRIEEQDGEAAAVAFADIAFGRATPIRAHVEDWFTRRKFSTGYRLDVERAFDRLEAWCGRAKVAPTVEALSVEAASRYVHAAFVEAGVHYKTANKDISCLSSYWRYLSKRLGRKANPWAEQRLSPPDERHGPRTDKKRPFTDSEVVTLLSGIAVRKLWEASLIAALSGMREDEIASLSIDDCHSGMLNVRKSKTTAGVRKVPIHPALSDLVVRLSKRGDVGPYRRPSRATPRLQARPWRSPGASLHP